MVDRQEIPKSVKLAVWRRAGGPDKVACEGCGLVLGKKPFQYDHTDPEWLQLQPKSERKKITADDVKLLGQECCHKPKTAREAGERAKDYAVLEKGARVRSARGRPMAGTKRSGWKKKISGEVVKR